MLDPASPSAVSERDFHGLAHMLYIVVPAIAGEGFLVFPFQSCFF